MTNWKLPTLGGMQFWTDFGWLEGCRLQQNQFLKQWRVIDANNLMVTWGNREHCESAFQQLVATQTPELHYSKVVILMHGLMRTARSMKSMAAYLETRTLGTMICPAYASTRAPIADHAKAFRCLVEALPGQPTIDLVGHSLGNIVVRHAIGDWQRLGDPKNVLERMQHMVMLGPPNQGAMIARRLAPTGLFGFITGHGGLELGQHWEKIEPLLAVPPFPFAIVAGKVDPNYPSNPLVDGASDFVVSVEETHLDGAALEVEVTGLHSFLMDDLRVQKITADFFESEPTLACDM